MAKMKEGDFWGVDKSLSQYETRKRKEIVNESKVLSNLFVYIFLVVALKAMTQRMSYPPEIEKAVETKSEDPANPEHSINMEKRDFPRIDGKYFCKIFFLAFFTKPSSSPENCKINFD